MGMALNSRQFKTFRAEPDNGANWRIGELAYWRGEHLPLPCQSRVPTYKNRCLCDIEQASASQISSCWLIRGSIVWGGCVQYCLLQLFGSYLLLNQADASNCLPSRVFKKHNHRDGYLGVAIRLLLGSHMAIYLHGRRPRTLEPIGDLQAWQNGLFLVGCCQIGSEVVPSPWHTLSKQCQVMPNPLSFTYEPLSLSSRTYVYLFARLWAEIRLKGQNSLEVAHRAL